MRRRDALALLGAAGAAAGAGAAETPDALRVRWMFSSGAQRDAMVRL
ncbi:MAG: twin-arginine translocation signal domain-containing protein, partial [Inhella sp.]